MFQPATVSTSKVIREMDADEIEAYASTTELSGEDYFEAMRQYHQLTGRHLTGGEKVKTQEIRLHFH